MNQTYGSDGRPLEMLLTADEELAFQAALDDINQDIFLKLEKK